MSQQEVTEAFERLIQACRPNRDWQLSSPLDVLGHLKEASKLNSQAREALWTNLFLVPPLPYWEIARWTRALSPETIEESIGVVTSPGWSFLAEDSRVKPEANLNDVLAQIAIRFGDYDADLFSCWGPDGLASFERFNVGRDLACCYAIEALDGLDLSLAKRRSILLESSDAWGEWHTLNSSFQTEAMVEGILYILDGMVDRKFSLNLEGVGRTPILLEHRDRTSQPAIATVAAIVIPLQESQSYLDGMVVPNIREMGVLSLSPDFLKGVGRAWGYCLAEYPAEQPRMLCLAIRPSLNCVVEQISGRSAETAVLAAIDSAFRNQSLRHDAAVSATTSWDALDSNDEDLKTGPASFGPDKFLAARDGNLRQVMIHNDAKRDWDQARSIRSMPPRRDEPDVLAVEMFRRDVMSKMETRAFWKLGPIVAVGVSFFFCLMALAWQMVKASAVPPSQESIDPVYSHALLFAGLTLAELICGALSICTVAFVFTSIRSSLDSVKGALSTLIVCFVVVIACTTVPIGVRNEGLIDNPLNSVLYGEPQAKPAAVVEAGGGGLLTLHAIVQFFGYMAILYGVCGLVVRLMRSRVHSEPEFSNRSELLKRDWRFSTAIMGAFFMLSGTYCIVRNSLWYYYVASLPEVYMSKPIVSFISVLGPMLQITVVLWFSVASIWLVVLYTFIARVTGRTEHYTGRTRTDAVGALPWGARLLAGWAF